MKEILKSKVMMGFIILVLGITYFNSAEVHKLDEAKKASINEVVQVSLQ